CQVGRWGQRPVCHFAKCTPFGKVSTSKNGILAVAAPRNDASSLPLMALANRADKESARRPPPYTLRRTQVQAHAASLPQAHLRLPAHARKPTAACLLHVPFAAAAWLTSIHEACRRLRQAPSDETIRQALFATLPPYHQLQRRLNHALAAGLPKALRRRRKPALDLALLPYHGAPQERAEEVYPGRPKAGPSHFHAYATAYVVPKGRRVAAALTGVGAGQPLADGVRRLMRQTRRTGVRPRLVLLDREFGIGPVIRSLRAARCPFVVGLRRRGRQPD